MKCGHPDVMENLRWNRREDKQNGLSLGGAWGCLTCSYAQHRKYRESLKGITAVELNNIRWGRKRRERAG